MTAFALICAGILGFSPADRSEYEAVAAMAGRDAGAHLKLALWCEAHGMDAERLKQLAVAIAIDPQNAAARGMMGLAAYQGRWLAPDRVTEAVEADKAMATKLAQYEARRKAAPETAEGHWQLALWCEQNGLKAEATAHLTAVTRLDPHRTDAWHRLGCQLYHGRWLNTEQVLAERAEDLAQSRADRYWQPVLEKWKKEFVAHSPQRPLALATLKSITDQRAVPSIRRVFGHGTLAQQVLAVEMLGQIDCPSSSHTLAALALFSRSRDVQKSAIEQLKRRDPRDFVDAMIGLMRHPLKVEVRQIGPADQPGVLIVEGEKSRAKRIYEVPQVVAPNLFGPGYVVTQSDGRTKVIGPHHLDRFLRESPLEQLKEIALVEKMASDYQRSAHSQTEQALNRDVAWINRFNAKVAANNSKVSSTLSRILGESPGADPDDWTAWWNDRVGYRYYRTDTPVKRTKVTNVPVFVKVFASCFAAGTPVLTLIGPRPIESLRVGDLVLSQDSATGALSYQPIVEVHHNPPDTTLQIRLKEETVVSTTYHRFWRPGRGWTMARDLKPGDFIRTLDGPTEVLAVEPGPDQPVFNLDVATTCTFFVGSKKELVHDNSLPPPAYTPFDAEPSLASIAGVKHPGH
jgi:hypothetical protein